jgi:hypothetical protein
VRAAHGDLRGVGSRPRHPRGLGRQPSDVLELLALPAATRSEGSSRMGQDDGHQEHPRRRPPLGRARRPTRHTALGAAGVGGVALAFGGIKASSRSPATCTQTRSARAPTSREESAIAPPAVTTRTPDSREAELTAKIRVRIPTRTHRALNRQLRGRPDSGPPPLLLGTNTGGAARLLPGAEALPPTGGLHH